MDALPPDGTQNAQRLRWHQFSLRSLFFGTAALAGLCAIWSRTSLFETAGYLISGLALWAAFRARLLVRFGLIPRVLVGLIGLTTLWFVAVDESVYFDECADCYYHAYVVQYKIAGILVGETTYPVESSGVEQVAFCLGVHCPHEHIERWHKHRYWGLLICGRPCINGTDCLVGDQSPAYVEALRQALRRLEAANPNLAAEFSERVLEKHDLVYWQQLRQKIAADPAMIEYVKAANSGR